MNGNKIVRGDIKISLFLLGNLVILIEEKLYVNIRFFSQYLARDVL